MSRNDRGFGSGIRGSGVVALIGVLSLLLEFFLFFRYIFILLFILFLIWIFIRTVPSMV
ncbi:hypothetical protein BDD12DRAFT_870578 [Trichophaea hybrida]|nr:hypothetical protein BDD12DRAFT_870578 [Trichophaea hybrida]